MRRPRLFVIGARIDRRLFVAIAVVVFLLLGLIWWVATAGGFVTAIFLPSPAGVWNQMVKLAANGTLWDDARISFYRIVIGFLIDMSNRMKVDWNRYKESTSELMLSLLPGDKK